MDDYISRQTAIDETWKEPTYTDPQNVLTEIRDRLYALPSADVAPVRQTAEWIYGEKDGADGWYCSKCKFHIPWYYEYYGLKNIDFIRDFHTCPHCDAKMTKYTGMKGEWNAKIH